LTRFRDAILDPRAIVSSSLSPRERINERTIDSDRSLGETPRLSNVPLFRTLRTALGLSRTFELSPSPSPSPPSAAAVARKTPPRRPIKIIQSHAPAGRAPDAGRKPASSGSGLSIIPGRRVSGASPPDEPRTLSVSSTHHPRKHHLPPPLSLSLSLSLSLCRARAPIGAQ